MILENSNTNALTDDLIIPVAAKSIESIAQFVGEIVEKPSSEKWCYVRFEPLAPPSDLSVWKHTRATLIQQPLQCWVHVDYTAYRARYRRLFPNPSKDFVIDHIRNRRFARRLGFNYVRLLHVSRGINSSSGRGEEYDVINYKNPRGLDKWEESKHQIDYADPSDILKMLNEKVGGFPLNNLREKLPWFYG